MDSSDNLRKVVCESHQAIKAFEPGNEREKQLITAFEDIGKFVEETQNCECSYCSVKHKFMSKKAAM